MIRFTENSEIYQQAWTDNGAGCVEQILDEADGDKSWVDVWPTGTLQVAVNDGAEEPEPWQPAGIWLEEADEEILANLAVQDEEEAEEVDPNDMGVDYGGE